MSKTRISQGSNGQYKVTIPKALGDGFDLDGVRVEWKPQSGSSILMKVVDDE